MKKFSKKLAPYLFMTPYFLLFIAFSLLPVLFTLFMSLNEWDGYTDMKFIGLDNYTRMFQNGEFVKALTNTGILLLLLLPVQLILAIIIAYMINSKLVRHKEVFKTAVFAPYLTIPIAAGLLWAFFFSGGDSGAINYLLQSLNIIQEPVDWLADPFLAKVVVSAIMLWRYLGYSVLFFMAGFVSIPEELYEAARVDGARAWHNFWNISLPMIKPITIYMVITSIIGCFQTFDEPNIIYTQGNTLYPPYSGGPDQGVMTFVMLMGGAAFQKAQYGYGSAVAYGMFIVIAVFSILSLKFMNGGEKDGTI